MISIKILAKRRCGHFVGTKSGQYWEKKPKILKLRRYCVNNIGLSCTRNHITIKQNENKSLTNPFLIKKN